jgi:hypothetical protein
MARVGVFGEMTGDNRSVTLGGRSRNEYIKSWINFDWFKKGFRYRKGVKNPEDYPQIPIIEDSGTDSVTTTVCRDDDGRINIDIRLPNLNEVPKNQLRIFIYCEGMKYWMGSDSYTLYGTKDEE